ncbi:MAG: glycosyl transferase [Ruminococcaceae bacterium]|nr:glycosyl transferase [Oscillospiraceae bacterium]
MARIRIQKKTKRIILFSFLALVLTALLIFLYYLSAGYMMYRRVIESRDIFSEIDEIRSKGTYIKADELPRLYLDGVVVVEDKNFYSHHGLDYIAIAKAVGHNLSTLSLSYGGSTITQQLAKNLFFTNEKKIERKAAEVFMVKLLEDNYTKEEILELYVNVIDFGEGYTGVLEASFGYYGKHPQTLTNEECAMLIGIPNAPLCYSPAIDPVAAEEKKDFIIERLKKYEIWVDDTD